MGTSLRRRRRKSERLGFRQPVGRKLTADFGRLAVRKHRRTRKRGFFPPLFFGVPAHGRSSFVIRPSAAFIYGEFSTSKTEKKKRRQKKEENKQVFRPFLLRSKSVFNHFVMSVCEPSQTMFPLLRF